MELWGQDLKILTKTSAFHQPFRKNHRCQAATTVVVVTTVAVPLKSSEAPALKDR